MGNNITTDGNKNTVDVSIDGLLIKEGDYIVSYRQALNLSSFGDAEEEAKEGFDEALSIFIDEVYERGIFEKVLLNLGRQFRKFRDALFLPPETDDNKYSEPIQKKLSEKVAIPI